MNGGRDEITGDQVGPHFPPLKSGDGPLDFKEIQQRLDEGMGWLAGLYANTMNVSNIVKLYDYISMLGEAATVALARAGCQQ
jgi:pyruvate-formate lyase